MVDFNNFVDTDGPDNTIISDPFDPTKRALVDSLGNLSVKDASDGPVSPGAAATYASLVGAQYNSTLPTLTNTQQVALQVDDRGRLLTVTTVNLGVADKSSFIYGTSSEQPVGGVYQDTSPALIAGQTGVLRLNANRAIHSTLRDPVTDVGVTTDNNGNSNNQRLHIATPDTTTASASLNALNASVTISMAGLIGCGFQLNTGTLSATLTPYISMDGGVTWQGTSFYDPQSAAILSNITVTNPNAYRLYMVITLGGTSHVKIQVTSYTSGSASALLRASLSGNVSVTPSGAGGGTAAFGTIINTTPSIPNNAATLIKAANSARKYLMISNPSGSLAYIALGNTTGLTTSAGIPVPARSFWEIKGDNLYTGPVYAISSSAITFYLSEGTP